MLAAMGRDASNWLRAQQFEKVGVHNSGSHRDSEVSGLRAQQIHPMHCNDFAKSSRAFHMRTLLPKRPKLRAFGPGWSFDGPSAVDLTPNQRHYADFRGPRRANGDTRSETLGRIPSDCLTRRRVATHGNVATDPG